MSDGVRVVRLVDSVLVGEARGAGTCRLRYHVESRTRVRAQAFLKETEAV